MPPKGRARGHIGDASYGKGTYGGRAASAGVVGGWDYLWDELHRKLQPRLWFWVALPQWHPELGLLDLHLKLGAPVDDPLNRLASVGGVRVAIGRQGGRQAGTTRKAGGGAMRSRNAAIDTHGRHAWTIL